MPALSQLPSYPGHALCHHLAFSRHELKGAGIVPPNSLSLDADSMEIRETESGDNFS